MKTTTFLASAFQFDSEEINSKLDVWILGKLQILTATGKIIKGGNPLKRYFISDFVTRQRKNKVYVMSNEISLKNIENLWRDEN